MGIIPSRAGADHSDPTWHGIYEVQKLTLLNLLRPSGAYMLIYVYMAYHLIGGKPLSEPMFEYCWLNP